MRMNLALVLTLFAAATPQADDDGEALAPDGRPGLGTVVEAGELLQRFRTPDEADTALLSELAGLGADLRVLVSDAEELYRGRGYFDALPPDRERTLEDLHDTFGVLEADPAAAVSGPTLAARAFVRLLFDTRFRVRRELIAGWERESAEVRRGVAVLRGALSGFVTLEDREAANLARRIDLSAALLRAMRSDLSSLREPLASAGTTGPTEETVDEFLALFEIGDPRERQAALAAALSEEAHKVDQMSGVLFHRRLREATAELLRWRQESDALARTLLSEAWAAYPDRDDAGSVAREIARLSKTKRRRLAREKAVEGLSLNPLDDELAWVAAVTSRIVFGERESVSHYDRFLVLHGIFHADEQTYRVRELTEREEETLVYVQQYEQATEGGRSE